MSVSVVALLAALAALFVAFALAGCGSGGGTKIPSGTGALIEQPGWTVHSPTYALSPKKWTFLVYLNAANNLQTYGDLNVNQMESIGSTSDVNIVVQWKRLSGSWTNTRRYYITKDANTNSVSSPLISENDSIDMGSAGSLQSFVQWAVQAYPSEHYCLVLWDHGAGWRAQPLGRSTTTPGGLRRGISYDDQTGNHIDTNELPAGMDIASLGLKWDLVTIDCSLMQMAEVAYQMRDEGDYILGSEESPPGEGLPYDTLLGHLTSNPSMSPLAFGTVIAQDTLADYGSGSNSTQSVIDTSKLPALTTAVNNLGAALTTAQQQGYGSEIAAARTAAESYGQGYGSPESVNYALAYKDLLDFTNQLAAQPHASVYSAAVQQVQTAASAAIAYNANGSLHPNSHGLSIYLPSPSEYVSDANQQQNGQGPGGGSLAYTSLAFAQAAPAWVNFLRNGPN